MIVRLVARWLYWLGCVLGHLRAKFMLVITQHNQPEKPGRGMTVREDWTRYIGRKEYRYRGRFLLGIIPILIIRIGF